MNRRTSRLLLAGVVVVFLVIAIAIGGLLAFTTITSESSTQVSATTSEAGEQAPEPDELILYVATDGEASEAIGDGVADRFEARGKGVIVAEKLEGDYDVPVVIVAVDSADFDRWGTTREATVEVAFYYSTAGTTEQWNQYRAGDSPGLSGPGAFVVGEIYHQERSRGLTTTDRYRAGVYGTVAEEILENYRGALA